MNEILTSSGFSRMEDVKKAFSAGGGVVWDDDVDIAAEYLYENSIPEAVQ